ncbi:transcriptional regulator [Pantoea vagans]|uniref:transcriptional regulator n=1 Tax=Pantoea vagans TaxID=470934 RepID=UPI0030193DCC
MSPGNQPVNPPVVTCSDVRELRLAAGLSQEAAAERFELSLRVWQTKEAARNPVHLSQGEYELLLLLAGRHPHYALVPKKKK